MSIKYVEEKNAFDIPFSLWNWPLSAPDCPTIILDCQEIASNRRQRKIDEVDITVFMSFMVMAWQLPGTLAFTIAASQYTGLSVCPPACLFQLASEEVSLTMITSTIVGEYHRVFYNYPGPKNEQCHTHTVQLGWAVPHSKILSQVFQVRFWCCKKQIWSTHGVDWDGNLKMKMTSKLKTT